MKKPTDFAYHLMKYLTVYLPIQRNFSDSTISSYRDTFKLFLKFVNEQKGIPSQRLVLKIFTKALVSDYLSWLAEERGLCARSLNQRLGAIHSFCKYLQTEAPEYIFEYQRILSIPNRRYSMPLATFLPKEALEVILNIPDKTTRQGRRDLVLLCVLYDTGARVSELCGMKLRDIHLTDSPYAMLMGKGSKPRYVPLMKNTASLLTHYLNEFHSGSLNNPDAPLFYNRHHLALTRTAVNHVVKKYAELARAHSNLIPEKITPHVFRHTKAMHLCQAGVDMIYIRDILGHVMLSTTQVYARINVERMRDAIENAYPELTDHNLPDWKNDDTLMNFLVNL